MTEMTLIAATQQGLAEEMRRDARVWALGEDLARGGVFGQYAGFLDEFGPKRVVSTPISEAMISAQIGPMPGTVLRSFSVAANCGDLAAVSSSRLKISRCLSMSRIWSR
jgi:hypothetical protein